MAWQDAYGAYTDAEIYVKRWDGTAWVEMDAGSASGDGISGNEGASEYVALVADSMGGALAAWQDDSGGQREIYLRGYALLDFGDAPDPAYPTMAASNGARHELASSLFLGQGVDAEPDGQPSPGADGDDANGNDDEDGIFFNSTLLSGSTASVTARASAPGLLSAWVDFNADGDWADPGAQILTDQALATGPNILTFTVPAGATPGMTFARFRFSTQAGLSFDGLATDGEVEDYPVSLAPGGSSVDVFLPEGGGSSQVFFSSGDLLVHGPGGVLLFRAPRNSMGPLRIIGSTGDDTLSVDFTGGSPIPAGSLTFNGGAGYDSLELTGGAFGSVAYNYTNANDGLIALSGVGAISYTGLEPILNTGTATDIIFNLTAAADQALLEDDGVAGNGLSRLSSLNGGFEMTTFTNPAGSLALHTGDGSDTVTVTPMDSGFVASLTVNGESGDDALDASGFATAITLVGGLGNDILEGGSGDDALVDGSGDDMLFGGDGNDVYVLTPGSADVVSDTGGMDTLAFSNAGSAITLDMDSPAAQAVDGAGNTVQLVGQIENFVGSPFADTVSVDPLLVARFINGGDPSLAPGDTLIVDPQGAAWSDTGSAINVMGFAPINYAGIETVTVLDATGPRVASLVPAPGTAVNASPTPAITVTFDEEYAPFTVNALTFQLWWWGTNNQWDGGDDVPLGGLITYPTALEATFTPLAALQAGEHQVRLAGTGGITDMAGNDLDGEFSGAFPSGDGSPGGDFVAAFTALIPDLDGPQVTSLQPAPNSSVNSAGQIVATFNEDLDSNTVTVATFLVWELGPDQDFGGGDDVPVAGNVSYDAETDAAVFTPGGALSSGTYGVRLDGASSIKDLAGNTLDGEFAGAFPSGNGAPGGDFLAQFTVDTISPRVTSLVPAPDALTNDAASIRATFSKSMKETSVEDPLNFKVFHLGVNGVWGGRR